MKYLALLVSVTLTVLAQTLMKIGGTSAGVQKEGILQIAIAYATSPLIVLGFGISAVAAFLWTYALSKLDFSYVSFVSSLSYVLVLLISLFVFKETIPAARWIGCAFIMVGIFFVLRS